MTHLFVWHNSFILVPTDSFIRATWLIHTYDLTHSYVQHDSYTRATTEAAVTKKKKLSVVQCVIVCCSVFQCVAACCGMLQCVVVWRTYTDLLLTKSLEPVVAVCCSVFSVLQRVAMCCVRSTHKNLLLTISWKHVVAVCCSVLQCVAVCCSVLCAMHT